MDGSVHIVCPHCDTINRVPRPRLGGGRCGQCHQALFEGHPVALDTARFERHLAKSGVPLLVEAREIIGAFHTMVRQKSLADLPPWLERARASLVASFASGVMKDQAAVAAVPQSSSDLDPLLLVAGTSIAVVVFCLLLMTSRPVGRHEFLDQG